MTKYIFILLTLISTFGIVAQGQTSTQMVSAADLITQLPDSEAIMFVDAKRLFLDALPLVTANDQSQFDRLNQELERFKEQTGIDARDFDVMAASLDFSPRLKSLFPPQGTLKLDPLVLARSSGSRNAAQILAAARQQTARTTIGNQKIQISERTTRYKNKAILRLKIDEGTRLFGLFSLGEQEAALAVLDDKTVAIGNLSAVRDAIDAAAGGGKRVDPKLARLAVSNANAVMGFAGVAPSYVSSRIEFGTPELSRPFRELRGFYGSIETGQTNFVLLTNLQTSGATAATDLSQTINLLKDFVPSLLNQLPAIFGKAANMAVSAGENATIKSRGDEVLIRVEIAPPARGAGAIGGNKK